ncbi:MAG: phenylalanine--tRNA ligase subunit beta [Gammaproteobacteria bacterium]|nr:phenylalanine--tRNA ligase subunit beta [Gammaproteobacteria bacterium]
MKFSESWLREWVDPDLSTEALGERLTMAGLEVANITAAAPAFEGVTVARVLSVEPHPNADRLNICQVALSDEDTVQVVCGAQNVSAGMVAPLARVGAVLPGDYGIKKAKLRGVESFGMLCSSKELGLTDAATGLMCLDDGAGLGRDIRDLLQLDDAIFELDLTPNRGDCLSIAGLAREVSVLTGARIEATAHAPVTAHNDQLLAVEILADQACPRYVGRAVRGIDSSLTTPLWMQERLRRSGIRSIAPVVDVTNYVMLELGQPMHAFDLAALQGGIRVRFANQGEELVLLDGRVLTLDQGTLVIADHQRALALAGIMGGVGSAVSESTQDIFLESAFFKPELIAGKARGFGLHTDSSHRFERGVDPQLQRRAIERATALLVEIVGGESGPVIDIANDDYLPPSPSIRLRRSRIRRLLGISPAVSAINGMLDALGCDAEQVDEQWQVSAPSFRFDLAIEADLIEEVARVYGYDNIPLVSQARLAVIQQQDEAAIPAARIRELLVDRGYQEAITYSFVDPLWQRRFDPQRAAKKLANPISSELAVMRTTLWPGLVKTARHNLNRQQTRIRLFEMGLRFIESGSGLEQTPMLAGLASGEVLPEQWGVNAQAVDFFDIKGDIEALLRLVDLQDKVDFRVQSHPALHPGQSAALFIDEKCCGWLGTLHPNLETQFGLGQQIVLFEIEQAVLNRGRVARSQPLSRFPVIRRDIAIVVDRSTTADQIRRCIAANHIDALHECYIFDVYSGKRVAENLKSLALGLILQDLSRTLTDKEVDEMVSRIVSSLERELGASLRE